MKKLLGLLVLASIVGVTAYVTMDGGAPADDAMMDNDDAMMEDDSAMEENDDLMEGDGGYVAYEDGVLDNGETKVLFFHAAWCPICQEADSKLKEWYGDNEFGRTVYKVDYDNSAELKAQYGVVSQHTFVVVDGDGNKVSLHTGPSDAELQALLNS